MKLDELNEMISKDFPITGNLGIEATRTSDLFVKYIKIYNNEKLKLESLKLKRKLLINEKREYYSGHAPAEVYKEKPFDIRVKTEQGIQKYIDSDPDIIRYDEQIILQDIKVETASACIDEINRRGYHIKDRIKYEIYQNGG